ncbi:hypothetical protein C5142_15050 [Rhodococcus sp. BGS-1C]|jgi:hypothetical protein|uniref:hypothetical protein n=1 Tax=unclassified Rhodococcus (in: high G+C Gram-positive bacteria) TaxID=192944 RepID=UPI0009596CCA|nr:hypothetical protein [Rhodococcus sp. KRD197]OLT34186.1 hypothetical protein BJF84_19515 [Rhodococcus sp. CUA-806]
MNIAQPRTLRVFVAGWVIQDGSFPRASVGDIADVVLEHYPSPVPSARDETRMAIARPAYGKAPSRYRDGRLRWLHLVYGDGWSSQWWTDEPTNGPVTLTGIFSASLGGFGIDMPPQVLGRIVRMFLVHSQVRPTGNGWAGVDGTDQLTEIDTVPIENDWWPSETTTEGDLVASGILIDLDLDDVPVRPTPFVAGAVAAAGDCLWVMHSSDPVLLRVETTSSTITRYLLPLTIEPTIDRWARRIHAVDDGCWITCEHDIHRCILAPDGELSVDRYTTEGGGTSAVHEGRLYLLGSTQSHMMDDRRHGLVRTYPDAQRLRMLNDADRRIVPVDGPADVAATRADRATGADGTQWCVDGTHTLRRIGLDGVTSTIDLSGRTATGTVRCTTPDAFADPANADVVGRITVDVSRFQRKAE